MPSPNRTDCENCGGLGYVEEDCDDPINCGCHDLHEFPCDWCDVPEVSA